MSGSSEMRCWRGRKCRQFGKIDLPASSEMINQALHVVSYVLVRRPVWSVCPYLYIYISIYLFILTPTDSACSLDLYTPLDPIYLPGTRI